MKRFRLAVLAGILCLGVTACGSGSAEKAAANVRDAVSETTAAETKTETVVETAAETAPETTAAETTAEGAQEIVRTYRYLVTPGEKRTDEGGVLEWTVEVAGNKGMKETLTASIDETSIYFPPADGVVQETDVNFDGHPDVLLFRGGLGAQSIDFYDCWIAEGSRLVRCEGFEEIPNPYVDTENRVIYGHVRDGAAAYYDLKYRVEGTKVVQTEETRYVYSEEAQDYVPEKE